MFFLRLYEGTKVLDLWYEGPSHFLADIRPHKLPRTGVMRRCDVFLAATCPCAILGVKWVGIVPVLGGEHGGGPGYPGTRGAAPAGDQLP